MREIRDRRLLTRLSGVFLGGTALCGVAPSLPVLIAGRVGQAVGACAGLVLGRAMVVADKRLAVRTI